MVVASDDHRLAQASQSSAAVGCFLAALQYAPALTAIRIASPTRGSTSSDTIVDQP